MSHTVVNLSHWPVSIRLNTGTTRHLAPGASLTGLASGEISGNAGVETLARRGLITVSEVTDRRSQDFSAKKAIEYIRRTPIEDLGDFVSADEDRVTVLRAFAEKQEL